jgi:integrase
VFMRHGAYHLDLGRDESGKRRSTVLSRVADGESALYAALAKVTKPGARTIADLLDAFMIHGMKELAPRTQVDYRGYIERQLRRVFGDMSPDDLETTDVAQYLERRKEKARASANKEVACLASAFQYGLRVGLCSRDPTKGVKRNRVKPKDRYVRHDEFRAYFDVAPECIQNIMAGIYLMGLRPGEAISLKRSQITPEGVRFQESKTGKVKLISWSPALQYFLTRATSGHLESPYVFTNSRGEKWTKWGLHSALRRLRTKVGGESWTWHDLRAKAESDSKDGMGMLPLYKRAHRVTPVR